MHPTAARTRAGRWCCHRLQRPHHCCSAGRWRRSRLHRVGRVHAGVCCVPSARRLDAAPRLNRDRLFEARRCHEQRCRSAAVDRYGARRFAVHPDEGQRHCVAPHRAPARAPGYRAPAHSPVGRKRRGPDGRAADRGRRHADCRASTRRAPPGRRAPVRPGGCFDRGPDNGRGSCRRRRRCGFGRAVRRVAPVDHAAPAPAVIRSWHLPPATGHRTAISKGVPVHLLGRRRLAPEAPEVLRVSVWE